MQNVSQTLAVWFGKTWVQYLSVALIALAGYHLLDKVVKDITE